MLYNRTYIWDEIITMEYNFVLYVSPYRQLDPRDPFGLPDRLREAVPHKLSCNLKIDEDIRY